MKPNSQKWEKWSIVKSTRDSTKYNIKDYRGHFLSAAGVPFTNVASGFVELCNYIKKYGEDTVVIKGHFRNYLRALGDGQIHADINSIGKWEKWKLTNKNNVEDSRTDGQLAVVGYMLIPLTVTLIVGAGSEGALVVIALGAGAGTVALNGIIIASIAVVIGKVLLRTGIEVLHEGGKIESDTMHVITAPLALVALFDAALRWQ